GLIRPEGSGAGVFAILPDSDRSWWIGTEWSGAFRTDGRTLERVPAARDRLYVRKIHRGPDGTVWFGTNEGIFRYENGRLVKVLESAWVLALGTDRDGQVWYGSGWAGGSLHRFNPKTGAKSDFGAAQGLHSENVWAIANSEDGGLWIGTSGGLFRY